MNNLYLSPNGYNLKQSLETALITIEDINNGYLKLKPKDVRNIYDKTWEIIIEKESDAEQSLNKVNNTIQRLEKYKPLLEKIKEKLLESKKIINLSKVGTLEGLSRQTIEENKISSDDVAIQSVLEQKYNELNAIHISGGKKSFRKNNKTKRKGKKLTRRKLTRRKL